MRQSDLSASTVYSTSKVSFLADSIVVPSLAQSIVDTVREPLLVLDRKLTIISASRSFFSTFQVQCDDTIGRKLYDLGDGQWDNKELRAGLEQVTSKHSVLNEYEVEHVFPVIGRRVMLLNAREIYFSVASEPTILLAIEDITVRRRAEDQLQLLIRQKELMLVEMRHRTANSLQIIASILMLKSRTVKSDEARQALQEAHKRIVSVCSVQRHLQTPDGGELVAIGAYLTGLCADLEATVASSPLPVAISVVAERGAVSASAAVSLGLVVTETVINALKHAFPIDRKDCRITVNYSARGDDWALSISDNGCGIDPIEASKTKGGLGTTIVKALAQQLSADVAVLSGSNGTTVSLRPHAADTSHL